MKIRVERPQARGLLLCGVPLARGAFAAGQGFVLEDGAGPLPLWWEERAHWPDGSPKWVFVHARLRADSAELVLRQGPVERPALGLAQDSSLEVDGACLRPGAEGWRFEAGSCSAQIRPGSPHVEPAQPGGGGPWVAELLEASPIAPLLRLRPRRREALYSEHLLRLDGVRGLLFWQQRISFLGAGLCRLRALSAELDFAGAGEWALSAGARRRLEVLRPGFYALDGGEEREGRPRMALRGGSCEMVLEKGWQRAPCALEARGDRVRLEFYPAEAAPLTVHPGTSFRHAVRLGLEGESGAPVRWSLDAEAACASGVFGPLMARSARTLRLFPGYEQAIEAGLEGGRLTRLDKKRGGACGPPARLADEEVQDEEYFGLMHYGDWPMKLGAYGGGRRMYADNEYDVPYAYFLYFLRTGEPRYARVAHHAAVHMADVDSKATDGDLRFHGYRETAENHAEQRTPGGDLGHYWTDGLVLNFLLMGDWWSWEAARAQVRFLLGVFAGAGDAPIRRHFLGCERAVGWPLTALAGVAEVTGEPELLEKMGQMAGFLARFSADPDRELEEVCEQDGESLRWWRICQEDGTKPFMLGVVLEGLERYHRLSGDGAAAEAVLHIARFLVDVLWVEGIEAFIYEWNAFNRAHREDSYPHYINTMVAPGLAYAYELSGEARFREVATRSFHAALWTLFAPGGGKEIGMVGRTSALMVARLHQWRQRDEQARRARMAPSRGASFAFADAPQQLQSREDLCLCAGAPRYAGGALVSDPESYAVYAFRQGVSTERGEIEFCFAPDWDCPPHPGPVDQRAYLHLCAEPFTRSCVSIISFYTGLHVRFYDAERHYIEVLETDIQDWRRGLLRHIRVHWDAEAGEAALWVEGEERDRRRLDRRLSGCFARLHLGHRPGNWRADGRIGHLSLRLGSV